MSNNKEKNSDINIVYSKIDNGLNDEEVIINNNVPDNDDDYYYYNNNINDFDGEEDDEKSDDTIVAFQEEKNANIFESSENICDKDLNNGKEESDNISHSNTNNIASKNSTAALTLKKTKKKKKKKKKEKKDKKDKTERIEIYAKDKNKTKLNKFNNIIKNVKIEKNKNAKTKKLEKNTFLKKLSNPINALRSKSLSKSVKDLPDKTEGGEGELFENAISDEEDDLNKIIKKKAKRKRTLKPIMTQFLLSIKEKNEYNIRLQKIRQQFNEKKFVNEQKFFYYVLKPGNGALLVKNSLKHRINWREAQMNVTSLFSFKWQPSTICIDYKNLSAVESIPQIVNHFEYHSSISNKAKMFLNLFEYCESNNINIWKYVPFTIFISRHNDNEKYFDSLYDNITSFIINNNNIDKNLNLKENEENYSDLFKTKIFKVFGRRKDIPKDTWMMGSRTPIQISDMHYDGKNFWILKATNLNRGQCIRLVDSKDKFHEIIKDWSQGINLKGANKGLTDNNIQLKIFSENGDEIPSPDTYVTEEIIAQKYIEKPLCYYGRKCDMRIWVLLTQEMKVYIYKEGHLKTCSEKYDINNNKDAFIHITNYSFQKHCLNFQKFELGNEVPFFDFQKYLDKEYKDKNVREHIMSQVKYIVELTMKSVKEKINPNKRNYCFEIFGYDFMMDVNLNVYLIEINTNPGLEISSPWIKAIVPRMVDDALRLTIDKVFPTKYQFDKNVINEVNFEDYSNDLSNKQKMEEKITENPRIVKKKKYVNICDQGSGTQDKNDEKYVQENLRLQEVKIQKKLTEINKKDNSKVNDINLKNNNNNIIKDINNKDKIKQSNNNENIIKKDKEIKDIKEKKEKKEDNEKEFNQKDYISPFPVPGYEPWENLWEFVCELKEQNTQNNYAAGVRGLLEIQKKRQATSAPINVNLNKKNKNNNNNVNENLNNNTFKEKNINRNIKEMTKNNNTNKNNKKTNKDEQKEKNIESNKSVKDKNANKYSERKVKEKNKDIEELVQDKIENKNIKAFSKTENKTEEQKNEEIKSEKIDKCEEKNGEIEKGKNPNDIKENEIEKVNNVEDNKKNENNEEINENNEEINENNEEINKNNEEINENNEEINENNEEINDDNKGFDVVV